VGEVASSNLVVPTIIFNQLQVERTLNGSMDSNLVSLTLASRQLTSESSATRKLECHIDAISGKPVIHSSGSGQEGLATGPLNERFGLLSTVEIQFPVSP